MSKYKKVVASNGVNMFYVDGVRVKPETLPEGLANRLQDGVEIEIAAGHAEPKEGEESVNPQNPTDDQVRNELGEESEEEKVSEEVQAPINICFIDGEEGRFKRFLQLQTVYLCDTHYHDMTSGEVVAAMRDKGYLE